MLFFPRNGKHRCHKYLSMQCLSRPRIHLGICICKSSGIPIHPLNNVIGGSGAETPSGARMTLIGFPSKAVFNRVFHLYSVKKILWSICRNRKCNFIFGMKPRAKLNVCPSSRINGATSKIRTDQNFRY